MRLVLYESVNSGLSIAIFRMLITLSEIAKFDIQEVCFRLPVGTRLIDFSLPVKFGLSRQYVAAANQHARFTGREALVYIGDSDSNVREV